jgi:hypothetical protein
MSNPAPGDRGTMIGATVVIRSGPQAAMLAQVMQTAAQAAAMLVFFLPISVTLREGGVVQTRASLEVRPALATPMSRGRRLLTTAVSRAVATIHFLSTLP